MNLSRLKINHRIGIAITLTIASILVVSISTIKEKFDVLEKAKTLSQITELGIHSSRMVHELQLERGSSAIFHGSQGKSYKKELLTQRRKTDESLQQLKWTFQSFFRKHGDEFKFQQFSQKVTIATASLKKLAPMRARTDDMDIDSEDSFNYYTNTIGLLVDIISEIAVLSPSVEVANVIIPYVALIEAKERAGRERGIGAGSISSGKFSLNSYKRVFDLQGQQEAFHRSFHAYANPFQKKFLKTILKSAEKQKVDRMREIIDQGGLKGRLQSLTAPSWFKSYTAYIDLLTELESFLVQNLLQSSHEVQKKAKTELYWLLGVIALFVFTSFFFILTIRSFTQPLLELGKSVIRLGEGDLDVSIPAQERDDEIGSMARTMIFFKKNLAERDQMMKDLADSKLKAEAANASKSGFLATMSHEIRTPMNGVLSCTNLLLDNAKKSEDIRLLKTVQSCGDSLLTIINDILDFSKIESGKMELENYPFDLKFNTQEVIDLLSNKASEKGILLSYEIDPSAPAWIKSDVTRFRQILTNLIGNAIKFTKTTVTVNISSTPLENGAHELLIAVKDNGIGISEEGQSRLFKSFSQVDASTTRKFGGTGLGLAICKGLTSAMGGKIWVESTEGQGATFSFTILTTEAEAVKTEKRGSFSEVSEEMAQNHPLRILMAEDNTVNQMVAKKVMAKLGYRIDVVANGVEAIEALKKKPYDLILMDQHMPEMDGIEATKHICRKWPKDERPKIVALTASAFKEDRERCTNAGMTGFLTKPIRIEELVQELLACESSQTKTDDIDETTTTQAKNPSDNTSKPNTSFNLIDYEAFSQMFAGSMEIVPTIAEQCLACIDEYSAQIHTAIKEEDGPKLRMAAHSLKGAISNFQASTVIATAAELERMGLETEFAEAPETFENLEELLEELKVELQNLCSDKAA